MADEIFLPQIDLNLCIGCGDCITTCPTNALGQVSGKAKLVHPGACTYCLTCEDICPTEAIELPFLIVLSPHEAARRHHTGSET